MEAYKELTIGGLAVRSYVPEKGPYLELIRGYKTVHELDNGEVEEMLIFLNQHKYRVRQAKEASND